MEDANPDGARAGSRHNANGVDLNRNFSYRWAPLDGIYESGPGAASEPETRALSAFIDRIRPRVTLWYHQALRMVVKSKGDPALEKLYSRVSGLPRRRLPAYNGTATSWQNDRHPDDTAFVVELPGGALSAGGLARNSRRGEGRGPCRGAAARVVRAASRSASAARRRWPPTPGATTGSTTTGCASPG